MGYLQNLVSMWDMSDVNPQDIGWRGLGAHMTGVGLVAATDIVDGIAGGKATEFNGTDEYDIRTVADWQLADDVGTIAAWIRPFDVAKASCIFASADTATDDYFFEWIITAAGVQYVYVYEAGGVIGVITGTTAMRQNEWQHLAVTSDGSNYQLYRNGVLDVIAGGATDSGAWFADVTARDNVTIGGLLYNSGLASPFEGAIDEVMYFDSELSNIQVADLYNRTRQGRI